MAAKRKTKMAIPVKRAAVEDDGIRKPAAEVLAALEERGLNHLVEVVALRFACTPLELCGFSRQSPIPDARAELWARLYDKPIEWSLPRIGEVFGVDHSTVIWQLKNRKLKMARARKNGAS